MAANGLATGILARSQRLHQQLLARRLASAKHRHDAALAALQQVIATSHEGCESNPESWRHILEARFAEADALSDYIAALRAYADPPASHVVEH